MRPGDMRVQQVRVLPGAFIKQAFSCGKANRPQVPGSVSSLIAFPCSGAAPYLHLKPNSKAFVILRALWYLSLGLVERQGHRQTATA